MDSNSHSLQYDVVVIGAGHAGCEAALAAARAGSRVLVVSPNLDRIGFMPCNPSIGGPGKTHLVAEIDALGGAMAEVTDRVALQIRRLNTSKGPAVQALRAQCDKGLYALTMKETLERADRIDLVQDEATGFVLQSDNGERRVTGIQTRHLGSVVTGAVVITAGTFLRGAMIQGSTRQEGGRAGEHADRELAASLSGEGFQLRRLKTGTPPRIDARSVDVTMGVLQPGDDTPSWLSFAGQHGRVDPLSLPPLNENATAFHWDASRGGRPQLACLRLRTTDVTHEVIRQNLDQSPMFNGSIEGVGPRYCPSIEDKVHRFADKKSHPLFLEPEGWRTTELYLQGFSTSLPPSIQQAALRTIVGLERARITRYGYAVEYDAVDPSELTLSLESRRVRGLFLAGQVNGTSGYEEAGAQGIIAGANATALVQGRPPLILRRDQAYIGVLIDDLVNRPFDEPYRMLTARAEHRLILRSDTSHHRLAAVGHGHGLVDDQRLAEVNAEDLLLNQLRETLTHHHLTAREHQEALQAAGIEPSRRPSNAYDLLRRPDVTTEQVQNALASVGATVLEHYPSHIIDRLSYDAKYAGFIRRAEKEVDRLRDLDDRPLPIITARETVPGLRIEARQQLDRYQPRTFGQAARLSGITPSDIAALYIHSARARNQASVETAG